VHVQAGPGVGGQVADRPPPVFSRQGQPENHHVRQAGKADFRFEYLGFVFQSFQLVPYLTTLENVMLPLSISKHSEKEQRRMGEDVLGKVDLSDKIDRLPNQISGGEAQRVAVARSIVNNPPILLADEPTGNLDSKNGMDIMKLLIDLNEAGQTIVMVTHDKGMAAYAHKILNLKDGRIVENGK